MMQSAAGDGASSFQQYGIVPFIAELRNAFAETHHPEPKFLL
jgi:hypothetical protein